MSKFVARCKTFYIHNKVLVLLLVIPVALYLTFTAGYLVNEKILNKKETTTTNQPIKGITEANKATTSPVTATDNNTPTSSQSTTTNKATNPTTAPTNTATTPPSATNPTTPTTPSSTPTPTPAPPTYIASWGLGTMTYSPTNCGTRANPCTVGQEAVVTAKFVDNGTGKGINVTQCSASGFQGEGPQTSDPYKPATTTMLDKSTCQIRFIAPNYGRFVIWADIYTDENTPQAHQGFNLQWFSYNN